MLVEPKNESTDIYITEYQVLSHCLYCGLQAEYLPYAAKKYLNPSTHKAV